MINNAVLAKMIEPLTWGRRLVGEVKSAQSTEKDTSAGTLLVSHRPRHAGLSLTYVGHTPLKKMALHASHLFIDRGTYARKPTTYSRDYGAWEAKMGSVLTVSVCVG